MTIVGSKELQVEESVLHFSNLLNLENLLVDKLFKFANTSLTAGDRTIPKLSILAQNAF